MNPLTPADATQRLVIHLNDHRAVIAGELAMAERSRSANEGTRLGHDLTTHIGQVSTDRDLVEDVIDRLGGSLDQLKIVGARAGELLGRLKLNGQLTGYSPLSRVVEIESLLATTHSRRTLWTTLATTGPSASDRDRALERSSAADDQLDTLHGHHRDAVVEAFDGASGTAG